MIVKNIIYVPYTDADALTAAFLFRRYIESKNSTAVVVNHTDQIRDICHGTYEGIESAVDLSAVALLRFKRSDIQVDEDESLLSFANSITIEAHTSDCFCFEVSDQPWAKEFFEGVKDKKDLLSVLYRYFTSYLITRCNKGVKTYEHKLLRYLWDNYMLGNRNLHSVNMWSSLADVEIAVSEYGYGKHSSYDLVLDMITPKYKTDLNAFGVEAWVINDTGIINDGIIANIIAIDNESPIIVRFNYNGILMDRMFAGSYRAFNELADMFDKDMIDLQGYICRNYTKVKIDNMPEPEALSPDNSSADVEPALVTLNPGEI